MKFSATPVRLLLILGLLYHCSAAGANSHERRTSGKTLAVSRTEQPSHASAYTMTRRPFPRHREAMRSRADARTVSCARAPTTAATTSSGYPPVPATTPLPAPAPANVWRRIVLVTLGDLRVTCWEWSISEMCDALFAVCVLMVAVATLGANVLFPGLDTLRARQARR